MTKVLVYKTSDSKINICTPVDKSKLQSDLSKIGKDKFKQQVQTGLTFEEKRNHLPGAIIHSNRLSWLENVKDFDNLTDEEFQGFIHCHTPPDHQYHHWMEQSVLPDVSQIHTWKDIDSEGKVTKGAENATS